MDYDVHKPRINAYIHCKTCFEKNQLQHLAVGWTKEGLQVFCETCNTNVADLDFLGQKVAYYYPAKDESQK